MKSVKNNGQSPLFWVEFMVMVGVLLLVVAMTLLGITKAHKISSRNQIELTTSMHLQNLMEYCKINKNELEDCLSHLDGVKREEEEDHTKWTVVYDDNWKQIASIEDASYSIEVHVKATPYTYGTLKEIKLKAYEIENYDLDKEGTEGIGKSLILDLEGSCIVREGA